MTKSPDAFRTISEVAEWLDTPAHVLRFWESKFSQVKPVKRAGGRRYYRPDDMALLGGIKSLLHEQGMTIKGAQKIMRERGAKWVCSLAPTLPGEADAEFVDAPAEDRAAQPAASNVVPMTPAEETPPAPGAAPSSPVGDAADPGAPAPRPDGEHADRPAPDAAHDGNLSTAPPASEPAEEKASSDPAAMDGAGERPATGAVLENPADGPPAPAEAEPPRSAPPDPEPEVTEAGSRPTGEPPEAGDSDGSGGVPEGSGPERTPEPTDEAPEAVEPEEAEPLPSAAVLEGPVPGSDAPKLPVDEGTAENASEPADQADTAAPLDADPPIPAPEPAVAETAAAAPADAEDPDPAAAGVPAAGQGDDDIWADLAPAADGTADPAGIAGSGALLADLAALPRGSLAARAGRIAPLVARLDSLAAEMARR